MHEWQYDIEKYDTNVAWRILDEECVYLCRELRKRGMHDEARKLETEHRVYNYTFWANTYLVRHETPPLPERPAALP